MFQMGVYMLIIASVDLYYAGCFVEYSDIWRDSPLCTLAGVLATFSTQASLAFLVLLTTDRFINIVMPFSAIKIKVIPIGHTPKIICLLTQKILLRLRIFFCS